MAAAPKPKAPARGRPAKPSGQKVDQTVNKNAVGARPQKSHQTCNNITSPEPDANAQDVDLVRETLRAICGDQTAPAAARAQAARTLAEMVGALGRHAAPPAGAGKALADMTRDELEAELAGLGGT